MKKPKTTDTVYNGDRWHEGVLATRQRISGSYGHNVGRCLDGLKELRERAKAAGMSFADYSLRFPLAPADTCSFQA